MNYAKNEEVTFIANGKTLKAKAKKISDAFYKIVEGEHKGKLVHNWSVDFI